MNKDIFCDRKFIYLWVPLVAFVFPHIFLVTGGYDLWIMPTPRESGFVENATALFFLTAGVYAVALARTAPGANDVYLLKTALVLFGAVAIWIFLEETSYLQNYVQYSTPDWFMTHNKNKEFNLHNLAGDKPSYAMRTAGYVAVFLAGIIAPLFIRFTGMKFGRRNIFHYFIPPVWMIIPSMFHLFANLPKELISILPGGENFVESHTYFSESGEYEEYMMGVWVIIYLVSVRCALRIPADKPPGGTDDTSS